MEKNTRPQKETWKVFGSDEILEDKELIDYYKLHLYDEKLINKLLGEFTDKGEYVLPDDVKTALVKVKKLITFSGENSYAAETPVKNQTMRFLVKYWYVEKMGIANLYFIENLDGEDMRTFVAQFIGENNSDFLTRVKAAFNLNSDIDEFADDYFDQLQQKYDFLAAKKAERDFVVEIQSEYYLREMLELLKEKGGEKGKAIAEQIEQEIEEKKLLINKEGMYTLLRLKMDKLIIASGGFNELKKVIITLPKAVQNYTKPVKDYDDISQKLDAMKVPDTPKTKAASGARNAAGKKAPKKGKPFTPPKTKSYYSLDTPNKPAKTKELMLGHKSSVTPAAKGADSVAQTKPAISNKSTTPPAIKPTIKYNTPGVMFDFADAYFLDKYSPSNINLVASSNQTKTLQMMDEKYVSSPKNESLEGVYLKETIKPTEISLLEKPAPKADLVDILVY